MNTMSLSKYISIFLLGLAYNNILLFYAGFPSASADTLVLIQFCIVIVLRLFAVPANILI